jgi:hypothetical protein
MNSVFKASLGIVALLAALILMCTGNTGNPFCVAVIALLFIAGLFLIVNWLLQEFASDKNKVKK